MPLWLPIAAGIAVVAVATLVVVMVAGGGTKSATSTTQQAVASSTTAAGSTTTAPTTTTTTIPPGDEAGGSWTVLVYGLGDNNLENDILRDLEEMAAVPAAALEFVALVDRTPDYTDRDLAGIGDWDTAKLITVSPGAFTEEADLGELNMGDPQVLADFVARGIQDHPADHYALILWDHGSIAGVGSDESSGDGLTVPEIAAAVRAGLDAVGTDRLDLIGFDACLMGAFEVAAAMPGLARYMVASEEVEPNDGWDYAAFDHLAAQPDTVTARSLGEEIVARYVATSGPSDPAVTLSLLDLSAVGDLVAALDGLNWSVAPQMATFAPLIGRGRSNSPSFGGSPVPEEDFYMVDLGDLLRRLSRQDPPLGDAAGAALDAFDRVVVASHAGAASSGATGMAIHFPPYPEYYYENWYRSIEAPVWPEFLSAYYSAGSAIPADKRPSFSPIDNHASFYFDDFGLNVEAVFADGAVDNIVEAVLYTGVVAEDGTVTFVGEDQGLYEGTQAVAANDLTRLVLDDGQDQAYAYQDISFSEDLSLFTLDVPLAYYAPGVAPGGNDYRDVTLKLTYDATSGEFTEGFYSAGEFGTVSEFPADPEGLIVPLMLTWYPDGTVEWVPTTEVGLWADLPHLLYDFEKLEPGAALYAELYVFDFGGNSDFASVETVVPAGAADWASCANDAWAFEVAYPADWFVWDSPTAGLECAYFNPSSLEGLTEEEAFDQALLTVEVYEAAALTQVLDFLDSNSLAVEDVAVAGRPATLYESARGEWGFRAYVMPLGSDPNGPTLVVAAWGEVDDGLAARADRVARSIVLRG
ncbi:MAG: clostripain-related cysteine peptidase [Actinomycetota bacterium]